MTTYNNFSDFIFMLEVHQLLHLYIYSTDLKWSWKNVKVIYIIIITFS